MADKPTPPDPAEGARRRKRPAPTIDLTATEVPKSAEQPQAAADEPAAAPPEPSAPPDEANTAHDPEPGLHTGSAPAAPAIWQIFIAGFAGAAIMTAALLGLWFAG